MLVLKNSYNCFLSTVWDSLCNEKMIAWIYFQKKIDIIDLIKELSSVRLEFL